MGLLKHRKCADCGFLGIVPVSFKFIIGEPYDVNWDDITEIPPHWREKPKNIYGETSPILLGCYMRQFHQLKCAEMNMGESISEQTVESITARRKCHLFYKYHPGYNPIEHKGLLRDEQNRRAALRSNIISALIGAVVATIVNIIWNILT
jgi:hypothetical protein